MYTIGQVLYIVLSKKNQVYPMQVIEVITKKTLKGQEVSYLLQAGSDPASTILLNKIEGEVFETSEKARSVLIKRASDQIDRLVDNAVKKSSEWYSRSIVVPQTIEGLPEFDRQDTDADTGAIDAATVTLPDGSVAKVKLPSNV